MTNVLLDDIKKLVSLQLGKREIRGQDRFLEDLGAESADVANIVAAAEGKYQITVKESEIAKIRTPADLFELVRKKIPS
jgi:acyl carrier protein